MTDDKIKQGKPWTNGGFYDNYDFATQGVAKLKEKWKEAKQEHMQTKIRRRANGKFLVKYRKDPSFTKEVRKNGKKDRKSRKRDSDKRETQVNETSV